MQKYRVTLLPEAEGALDDIFDKHFELVGVNSAEHTVRRIKNSIDMLADNPFMGTVPSQKLLAAMKLRKLVCGVYICLYRVIGDVVEIVDIVDGRTNYIKRFLGGR